MTSPEASEPTTDPAGEPSEDTPDPAARRTRTIRFVAVLGVAGVVAVGAIVVAVGLNQPSGSKPTTPRTITAGPVVSKGNELTGGTGALPALAVVLNRTDAVSQMTASNQVVALRAILASKPTAAGYTDLGQAYMALGDQASAEAAFTRAAELAPNSPEPLTGLAMTMGMSGTAGQSAAAASLQTLAARFPDNQTIAFNLGWLALYRRDVPTLKTAWARTVALGPTTPLGKTAATLLSYVTKKSSG